MARLLADNLRSEEKSDVSIIIEGVAISPENASNVLAGRGVGKDGCVSYDYTTHTLTLTNAKLTKPISVTYDEEATYPVTHLPIVLKGKNSITTTDENCITTSFPLLFTGDELELNPLSDKKTTIAGIMSTHYYGDIILRGCSLDIPKAKYPFGLQEVGDARLIIDGAKLHTVGLIAGFYLIEVHHSAIDTEGVEVEETSVDGEGKIFYQYFAKDGQPYKGDLSISKRSDVLPLFFNGEQVISSTPKSFQTKSGKATYNDQTQTLTLDHCVLEADQEEAVFHTTIDGYSPNTFKVELIGENSVSNKGGECFIADASITFTGGGTLRAIGNKDDGDNSCLFIDNRFGTIRVEHDTNVILEGGNGIATMEEDSKIDIDNARLELIANAEIEGAAMLGIAQLKLSSDCAILEPVGGHFDPDLKTISATQDADYAPHVILGKKADTPQSTKRVVMKTLASVGDPIAIRIAANGDVSVSGVASGIWSNNEEIIYTVAEGQTITFSGDITKVIANDCKLTSIDLTEAPSLGYIEVQNNQLTELDLSHNDEVTYIYAQKNQLSRFIVSRGGKVNRIYCVQNKLNLDAMEELIESLPDRTSTFYGELGAIELLPNLPCENICSKTLVEKAASKKWIVKAQTNNGYEAYEGSDNPGGGSGVTGNEITFETSKAIGSTIDLTIEGTGDITLEGVEEAVDLSGQKSYTLKAQKLILRGDVTKLALPAQQIKFISTRYNKVLKSLDCSNNPINLLNLTENAQLRQLNCHKMNLQSLDLSKNANLIFIDCAENNLTDLDFSALVNLSELNISKNRISGKWMEKVATTLVARSEASPGKLILFDTTGKEGNSCTKRQAALFVAKHWQPFAIDASGSLSPYEGSEDPYLTLTTSRKAGDKFNMKIESEGDVIIEGLKGSFENGKPVTYEIVSPNITVKGQVVKIHLYKNDLTSLDLTNATSLDWIDCSANNIDDTAMAALIQSLPKRAKGQASGVICVFDEKFDKEHNVCTKRQVYLARQKDWVVKKYGNDGYKDYEGIDEHALPPVQTNNIIKMKTTKPIGDKIILRMQQRSDADPIKFNGIEGYFAQNQYVEYTIQSQTFSVQGDIYDFECFDDQITELDLSDCHSIEVLNCAKNEISTLDLTKLRKLELVFCYNNNLSTLDLSGNPKLFHIDMRMNKIGVEQFDTIVKTICNKQYDQEFGKLIFVDKRDPNVVDANRATATQVQAIKDKKWLMLSVVGMTSNMLDFEEYTDVCIPTLGRGSIQQQTAERRLLFAEFAPRTNICLYNLVGELVASAQTTSDGSASISYASLPQGIYFVQVPGSITKVIL